MDNNDLLRRLRYALRCDDSQTSRIIKLGGGSASTALTARFRAKETEPEFLPCGRDVIGHFLDGLILENRGPKDTPAPSPWPDRSKSKQSAQTQSAAAQPTDKQSDEAPSNQDEDAAAQKSTEGAVGLPQMDNNIVLKQLRIALSLRSDDVHHILKTGGSALTASEAGALFRKPDARNYRQCGDQVLRQFIAGLVKRRDQDSQDSQDENR